VKWVRYRIEVGSKQGISAGDVVGAIANEAGLDSQYIGAVQLADDYCTVELPDGMPRDLYRHLQKVRLRQHPMHIHVDGVDYVPPRKPPKRKPRGGKTP
jgi:ATP-dependent RNA helicase DeaD